MDWAAALANLETAYNAVSAALVSGEDTVEYEIRGRRHKVVPSSELLKTLREEILALEKRTASSGRFRLAAPRYPTRTGT